MFFNSKGFWEPMPCTKRLVFADMRKPLLDKTKDKLVVDSEVLFHRMQFVSKFCDENLKIVLQDELTTVSLCLFHDDGMMWKNVTSGLDKKA